METEMTENTETKILHTNTVIYNSGELELKISVNSETIWLNQAQMSELFGTSSDNIGLHLKNIYKERELDENATTEEFSVVRQEGNRQVKRNIKHYNLDAVISVGYRINSLRATKFRQWATSILKNYIQDGYAINSEKITDKRFKALENDVLFLKSKVENITNLIEEDSLKPKQGIFYDGQVFDAYVFVSDLIKRATKSIVLIDNFVDESVLILFSKNQNIDVTIYTKNISKQLKLDLKRYNAQYKPIEIKPFKESHDRFMIIDEREVYHLGASLKDLGKKWFAFSRFDMGALEMLGRLS